MYFVSIYVAICIECKSTAQEIVCICLGDEHIYFFQIYKERKKERKKRIKKPSQFCQMSNLCQISGVPYTISFIGKGSI